MKILSFAIGKQNSELKVANKVRLNTLQPQLKMLNADTVSFTGAAKVQDKYLDPTQISKITEAFTQGLVDLKKAGNLTFDTAKDLIVKLLPGRNIEILSIEDLITDMPQLGNPKEQNIFGVFTPVMDEAGKVKFKLYYDFSNSEKADQKDFKKIAQVHEFVHLLQANTEYNYKMIDRVLKEPPVISERMNGMFHALEYRLYTTPDLTKEQYVPFVKEHIDTFFSREETPDIMKFCIMNACNETQAYCESLKSLQKVLKLEDLPKDNAYKVVHDTAPLYINFAEATITLIKQRDDLLNDNDRKIVKFYEAQLDKLKEDYSKLDI